MKNSIRIISGRWRGRKLAFPDAPHLRPTSDRLRETLFNWLSPFIQNTSCLDLFAGSGSLAWESLSRGARQVTLIDANKKVVQNLQKQAQLLDCALQTTIIQTDSVSWLAHSSIAENTDKQFDLVFLDPPFKEDRLNEVCELLDQKKILSETARIYIESSYSSQKLDLPKEWVLFRNKKIGMVYAHLFIRKS